MPTWFVWEFLWDTAINMFLLPFTSLQGNEYWTDGRPRFPVLGQDPPPRLFGYLRRPLASAVDEVHHIGAEKQVQAEGLYSQEPGYKDGLRLLQRFVQGNLFQRFRPGDEGRPAGESAAQHAVAPEIS